MTESVNRRLELARQRCDAAGQGHLLHFWPQLSDGQRAELLDDLERIDFTAIPHLVERYVRAAPDHASYRLIEPAMTVAVGDPTQPDAVHRAARARGDELIRAGKVAALLVAGGQGTRLGFDGPKGCLPISPVAGKTLFQLFAEQILATGRRTGRPIRWYVMTSPANDAATRTFFAERRWFGLDEGQVMFFQQGVMPAFAPDGRILLEDRHRVALAPNGHGGTLLGLASSGALADMAAHGIELLSYFQVDNPLVRCVDPLFVGLHAAAGCEMSCKVTAKVDNRERVGNCVRADGAVRVIEYSDLPDALATARNADGSRRFNAANLAIHLISRRLVERLTADPARFALPWHRAEKKAACVDLASGRQIEPDRPNAIKLESFIFDALPLSEGTPLLLEVERAEDFSPVKNAAGVDSVETARRDMVRRAARWLERAGVSVPCGPDGETPVPIEISPLRAMSAADLSPGDADLEAIRFDRPVLLE